MHYNSPMKVDRICQCCKKTFTARSADVKRGWALFCSKRCKAVEQERRTGQYADYRANETRRDYDDAMESVESGWDGHKDTF